MEWDGMGWDGIGQDGIRWDGMGWDQMGCDGMGWNGMELKYQLTSISCTSTLHQNMGPWKFPKGSFII